MYENITSELIDFLKKSPTCFHAAAEIIAVLKQNGYSELSEGAEWKLKKGGKYFVSRNGSSVIAFRIPGFDYTGMQIAAAHTDSPMLKIKCSDPEMVRADAYVSLNVEVYGGMLMAPWFDRPLSVAGRVIVERGNSLSSKLVDVGRDLVLIPNVAIHMNRDQNKGVAYNEQTDLIPLFGSADAKGSFNKIIAKAAGVSEKKIVASDLFVYNRTAPAVWGAEGEFFSAPRIDDLECAYTLLKGFVDADENAASVPVYAAFDNEEVGSLTKQGADSTFLADVIARINDACGKTRQGALAVIANSMMASGDNAHAVHPNHPELCDPVNKPQMNKGIVLKFNANQHYTTDAVSEAMFRRICEKAGVPCQQFVNRSDMRGGGTLGNISNAHVSLNTFDIGLAQLAMHSPYETAGTKDPEYMALAMKEFFSTAVVCGQRGTYEFV
ncbi:MAG: M18 family aminopeptidase [Eubacterium sp.]|jgi:aspartyl aminopeptidase